MIRKILLLFTVTFLIYSCNQQKEHTVMFYNVENLFDTINDPIKWDDDFTPNGKLKYCSERYYNKLSKLSKVIASIDSVHLPSIIGLCEIENRTVLEDITKQESLKRGNYHIAHIESPDKRGIDCALLYKSKQFKLLKQNAISIQFPWDLNYKTRDILHVKGILNKDTIHIFVNHWPSRRGGKEKSEKNRIFVAEQLKKAVDHIQSKNEKAKIIIMGDFNDEPADKSVIQSLSATNKQTDNYKSLFNLMYDLDKSGRGTYNYRGNWNMLDHLIVSNSLLQNTHGIKTSYTSARIFDEKWICYKNKKGLYIPSRTYGGPNYYGGYSDHFPIYFTLNN
jgi:predicted extracellular nuclease